MIQITTANYKRVSKTAARRLFHRLVKGYYQSEYIVLNDGNYHATIWASSPEEAVERFLSDQYGEEATV